MTKDTETGQDTKDHKMERLTGLLHTRLYDNLHWHLHAVIAIDTQEHVKAHTTLINEENYADSRLEEEGSSCNDGQQKAQ
eukprot:944142-Amphidinium_carterae.1